MCIRDRFQPSEFTKIGVILFVAYAIYQSRRSMDTFTGFLKLIGVYVLPVVGLIAAENLSTAIIVGVIAVGMCFVASKRKKYFIVCGIVGVAAAAAYAMIGGGFRAGRITSWLDIENSPGGFQILQGLYAIASGGIHGSGLGESMQKLGFIPESYNDMIFSIVCEETGILGAFLTLFLFGILIWRLCILALNCRDLQGTLLCAGIMAHMAIQVVLNVAVVTNTIPNTGITLPFVSYGGTSVVFLLGEMGLALSVSSHRHGRIT